MKVRVKIENLSLEEIYEDYCTIKAMYEKYYYGNTDKIKNASDALMDILKNEIIKRNLKELEEKRNKNLILEAIKEMDKGQGKSMYQEPFCTITDDFVNELQNYTTSYSCETDGVHYNIKK